MKVILNVDDLGLRVAITCAVLKGVERGVVTSASVLANGPDIEHVAELAAKGALQNLSLGANLNILRGTSISNPEKIPSRVRDGRLFLGSYTKLFQHFLRMLFGILSIKAIRQRGVFSIARPPIMRPAPWKS